MGTGTASVGKGWGSKQASRQDGKEQRIRGSQTEQVP